MMKQRINLHNKKVQPWPQLSKLLGRCSKIHSSQEKTKGWLGPVVLLCEDEHCLHTRLLLSFWTQSCPLLCSPLLSSLPSTSNPRKLRCTTNVYLSPTTLLTTATAVPMLKPQIWNMKFMSQILSNPSNAHLCHDNGGLHNESLSLSLSLSLFFCVCVCVSILSLSLCVCLWSASDFWVPNLLPEIVELLDWGEVAASNPIFFSCSSWISSSSSSSVHIGLFCFIINEFSSTLQNSQHSQQPPSSSWCHPIDHSLLWVAEWTWWWCYICCQKLQSKVFHVIIAPVIMLTHKALSLLEVLAYLLKMELAKSSQACGSTCVCAEAKVWTAEYVF